MQWIAFLIIAALLIIHGIWPAYFVIDKFSMGLLFLLAIPMLAPFLKKAKGFGFEFEFNQEIKKALKFIEKSEEQAKQKDMQLHFPKGALKIPLETFSTQNSLQLLDSDPNLALASLRIEIDRVLQLAVKKLIDGAVLPKTIKQYIEVLLKKNYLSSDQAEAFNTILNMCNEAVHGAELSKSQAKEIITLMERLNNSFSLGYSINVNSNDTYEEQGLVCEWQHCIENFPIHDGETLLSCPIFGHDCPGGKKAKDDCVIREKKRTTNA